MSFQLLDGPCPIPGTLAKLCIFAMRLLKRQDDGSFVLTRDYHTQYEVPRYAALSHTWLAERDEVTYSDMTHEAASFQHKAGYKKLKFCCDQAAKDGLDHFWVDSCCIDKTNSQELSEAINTMYRWYRNTEKCYALLSDVSATEEDVSSSISTARWKQAFVSSRWHSRGWCLQELLAPRMVDFYSRQGVWLGNKATLQSLITEATNIPKEALQAESLTRFTIDQRMSWARHRETSREEDKAYCLLGIFEVFIPPIYGEGDNAFDRLQDEIMKKAKKQEEVSKHLETLSSVPSAAFNSTAAGEFTLCDPHTRIELLKEIHEWVEEYDSRCVFWLNGMAGTGKSTVARTIAHEYYNKGYLGGSFFFSLQSDNTSRADELFATLASQMARQIPSTSRHISDAISGNGDITRMNLREQWEHLILRPLSKISHDSGPPTVLFVLDALDECDEKNTHAILRLLGITKDMDNVRLRIFITSRPETPIRYGFQQIPVSDRLAFVLRDIAPTLVDRNLSLFFEDNFNDLREERARSADVLDDAIISLPTRSTYASSLPQSRQISETRITTLVNLHKSEANRPTKQLELDTLYTSVLSNYISQDCDEDKRQEACKELRNILGSIVSLFSPLPASALENLLDLTAGSISESLEDLDAIFNVSEQDDRSIRLHHPSFRDFIRDPIRCTNRCLQVTTARAHEKMAKKCIKLMSKLLKQNICGLESPGIRIGNISVELTSRCILPELQYACLHWAEHLKESGIRLRDNDEVHLFLQQHFLHWFEVIMLIRKSSEMAGVIRMYQSLLVPGDNSAQLPFIKDSRRFMFAFQSIAEQAPLQIYCSGLAFIRPSNLLRTQFWKEMQPWISDIHIAAADAPEVKDAYNYVNNLAFTPDGRYLASGSIDEFVRVWDVTSKTPLCTFDGQTDKVSSVAITADGRSLASGSDDSTIMVWDMDEKTLRYVLNGHTSWVNAVVFSPNNKILASGSMDETIKIWNTDDGTEITTIPARGTSVKSLAFSPDGSLLASGTVDQSVRLWDVDKGEMRLILDGHSGPVNSVRFSRGGRRLASGSDDMTVRIWDVFKGDTVLKLTGHTNKVWTVNFSYDARRIVSGSEDKTIKLWNATTGEELATLAGHTSGVNAVSYSPDGKLLASCAFNDEVMLWNAETGESRAKLAEFSQQSMSNALITKSFPANQLGISTADLTSNADITVNQERKAHAKEVTCVVSSANANAVASGSLDDTIKLWRKGGCQYQLQGHSSSINHLAFSPFGDLLASASADKTAKLWAAHSGALLHDLAGHSEAVRLVVFSHDGRHLATSSTDRTIILWRTATGALLHQLRGHADTVTDVAFSPDDRLLASSSADQTARVWDVASGIEACAPLVGHTDALNSVAFSSSGQLLASSSSDSSVKIYDTSKPGHGTLLGHTRAVRSATFSEDMRLVVSCSDDLSVRIWDLASRTLQLVIEVGVRLRTVSFCREDREIATDRGYITLLFPMTRPRSSLEAPKLFVTGEWLQQDRKDALWLDKDHHATSVAISNGSAILGHASGAISFISL